MPCYDKIIPNMLSKADLGYLQHLIMEMLTTVVNIFNVLTSH